IAAMVPQNAEIRVEPDFQWMLASAHFLSRDYAGAEQPLLDLFHSSRSSETQQSAAAYGLCGVYQKIGKRVEQIRYALWLRATDPQKEYYNYPAGIRDGAVYWATSGWDLNLLLESEASIDDLRSFLAAYHRVPGVRLVKYSLAVRLTRESQYDEA